MNASGTSAIDSLARLEARVRWLTALCFLLTIGLLALVAWQFVPRARVVEANAFVLRDAQWRRRGALALREDGSPMLRLDNAAGRERVMISAREDGRTVIRLTDGHDVFRARFELDRSGHPVMLMSDADGKTRLTLAPLGAPYAGAQLLGSDGKPVWSAP